MREFVAFVLASCSFAAAACSKREAPKVEPPPVPVAPVASAAATAVALEASAPAAMFARTNPCPSAGTCRILPLGDSITFGFGGAGGGYRVPLFRIAQEKKRDITFVGRQKNGPPVVEKDAFPRGHEGYPGYTVEACGGRSGLAPLVEGALVAAKPHVVLLMIGTNDVGAGCDLVASLAALERLVGTVEHVAPEATLVVASLVASQDEAFDTRASPYDVGVAKLAATHAAQGRKVRFVDMRAAFEAVPDYRRKLLTDTVHPSDSGYAVMAEAWAPALGMAQ